MKKNEPLREVFYHSLKKTLLIMRIAVILLLFGFLQTRANNAWSQETKLSVDFSNTELVNVLDQIENETEFLFIYNEKLIDANRKVSIHAQDQGIEEVLKLLFAGTDVEYSILDRKIILSPMENGSTTQQQKSISGKVTDSSGAPLPGVTVVVKGTTQGIITDTDGNFTLAKAPRDAILVFSFVGMETQEIAVAGKTTINIVMQEETVGIEEVVAIGYGTVKKKDLTGSVASVAGDMLASRKTIQLSTALQGAIPGVMVTNSANTPEGVATIRIRGITTIGTSDPLYIIDGIPSDDLSRVNPNDVESISVLKDAASAAI